MISIEGGAPMFALGCLHHRSLSVMVETTMMNMVGWWSMVMLLVIMLVMTMIMMLLKRHNRAYCLAKGLKSVFFARVGGTLNISL